MRRRPVLALAVFSAVAVLAPVSARASTPYVTGVHVAAVGSTSFTVTLKSFGAGWRYRLYTSTYKPNIYAVNLSRAQHSSLASTPRVGIGGLHYSTSVYWYRIQAVNGSHSRLSDMYSVGLRPATPTAVRAASDPRRGTSVTWSSGGATGATIQRASDAGFTRDVHTYALRGAGHQFTPYGLTRGAGYYLRVRAVNNGTPSAYTAPVRTVAASAAQPVRVMTYNIAEATVTSAQGGAMAPWPQRRPGVTQLINETTPDVIAIQEAAAWMGAQCSPRQIDDLVSALRGKYALAQTEYPPCTSARSDHLCHPTYSGESWMRTGNYILYDPAKYAALGGWYFAIGDNRWAPYQILQNRATGAEFLFVAPHIVVGSGAAYDQLRENETKSMISQAGACAAAHGNLPIIYAGDFNSHDGSGHVFDGPAIAMRAVSAADALEVAQSLSNQQYNSANDYNRTPPAFGQSIDHIYASPGVALTSWRLILNLSHGEFVGVIPSDHNPLVSEAVYPY